MDHGTSLYLTLVKKDNLWLQLLSLKSQSIRFGSLSSCFYCTYMYSAYRALSQLPHSCTSKTQIIVVIKFTTFSESSFFHVIIFHIVYYRYHNIFLYIMCVFSRVFITFESSFSPEVLIYYCIGTLWRFMIL